MKKFKLATVIFTIAAMALGVTACGKKFDAKLYVQGNLDALYKNEISDDFAKQTVGGREGIEQAYNESIEEITSAYKQAGCPDELIEDYKIVIQDLLKACKYSVGEPVKGDNDDFTVPVEITPINTNSEAMNKEAEEFLTTWMTENAETGTQEEALMEFYTFMLGKMQELAANPTYGETQTVELHVVKANDTMYEIPVADQDELFSTMLGE